MAAFNAIKSVGSGSTKKTMFIANFILNSLLPVRQAFYLWHGFTHYPHYANKEKALQQGVRALLSPIRRAFTLIMLYDKNRGRAAMKKLLFNLSRTPRGYLIAWRNACVGIKHDQLGEHASFERTARSFQNFSILIRDLQLPLKRLAFKAIVDYKNPLTIKRAITNIAINLERAEKMAFHMWKMFTLRTIKDQQIKRQPNVMAGVGALDNFAKKKRRAAVCSVNRNRVQKRSEDQAVKKLVLIYKSGMRSSLNLWKNSMHLSQHGDHLQGNLEFISNINHLHGLHMILLRKILMPTFAKLKIKTHIALTKKVLRRMVGFLKNNLLRTFLLWSMMSKECKMQDMEDYQKLRNAGAHFIMSLKNGLQRAFNIWKFANISRKHEDKHQANDDQMFDLETKAKLGKVVQNMTLSLKNEVARAFFIWKLANTSKTLNDELDAKHLENSYDKAVNKLKNIRDRKRRDTIASIRKNKHHEIVKEHAVKKLLLWHSGQLGHLFFKWKSLAEQITVSENATGNASRCHQWALLYNLYLRRKALAFRMLAQLVTHVSLSELSKVQAALNHVQRNLHKALDHAFYLWRSLNVKSKNDEHNALSRLDLNRLGDGFFKLVDLYKARLRYGMMLIALKRSTVTKIRNALVKARLIYRKKLMRAFNLWKSKTDLHEQKERFMDHAETAFMTPNLKNLVIKMCRKSLRLSFTRLRDGPRNLLERVGRKANEGLNNQMRKANRCMLRSANDFKEKRINMMWKWKVAQIAFSLGKQMTNQEKQHHGAQHIGVIIRQAILRDAKLVLDRMKRQKGNIFINLWKVMQRTADVSTRKAWTIWSNCLYKDQALDWEHHYMQTSALHPLFINFSRFHERQDYLGKNWAWQIWSATPKKTLIKALNRVRADIYANLRNTMEIWRLKCRMMENAKLARIMFLISNRLADSSTFNLHYAFRLWAPNTMKMKIKAKLKHLAVRANNKVTLAFFKWRDNAKIAANERLLNIIEANGNLITMYMKYEKLNVKLFFDKWKSHNRNNKMRYVISRMIGNVQHRQKDGFKNLCDAVKRRTIVIKTISLCKMIDLKERDYAQSLQDAFRLWKSLKGKRGKNLLWKYCNLWMNKCRIGYQPALWRWKCVIKKYDAQYIFPHHKIMMKHLYQVFGNAQLRMIQSAFYKCVVVHANPDIWASRQSIFGRESMFGILPEYSSEQVSPRKDENDHFISTPKSERELRVVVVRETLLALTNLLSRMYMKNVLSAFNLIQVVSDDFLTDTAIKDLREDNQALRFHNEALSDNLQRSTQEYDLMAQHLDTLRLFNLMRVLDGYFRQREQDGLVRIQLFRED